MKPSHEKGAVLVYEEEASNETVYDSLHQVFIGDCFILDSVPYHYGFMVYEMTENSYAMAPVKLNLDQQGIQRFEHGSVRMAGGGKNKYPECMHVWSAEEKQEFLAAFNKVGHLNLKRQRPAVQSYGTMLKYNLEAFKDFIWFQNSTYDEDMKVYPSVQKLLAVTISR